MTEWIILVPQCSAVCAIEIVINLCIHNVWLIFSVRRAHKKGMKLRIFMNRKERERESETLNHDDFLAMAHSNASYK